MALFSRRSRARRAAADLDVYRLASEATGLVAAPVIEAIEAARIQRDSRSGGHSGLITAVAVTAAVATAGYLWWRRHEQNERYSSNRRRVALLEAPRANVPPPTSWSAQPAVAERGAVVAQSAASEVLEESLSAAALMDFDAAMAASEAIFDVSAADEAPVAATAPETAEVVDADDSQGDAALDDLEPTAPLPVTADDEPTAVDAASDALAVAELKEEATASQPMVADTPEVADATSDVLAAAELEVEPEAEALVAPAASLPTFAADKPVAAEATSGVLAVAELEVEPAEELSFKPAALLAAAEVDAQLAMMDLPDVAWPVAQPRAEDAEPVIDAAPELVEAAPEVEPEPVEAHAEPTAAEPVADLEAVEEPEAVIDDAPPAAEAAESAPEDVEAAPEEVVPAEAPAAPATAEPSTASIGTVSTRTPAGSLAASIMQRAESAASNHPREESAPAPAPEAPRMAPRPSFQPLTTRPFTVPSARPKLPGGFKTPLP